MGDPFTSIQWADPMIFLRNPQFATVTTFRECITRLQEAKSL